MRVVDANAIFGRAHDVEGWRIGRAQLGGVVGRGRRPGEPDQSDRGGTLGGPEPVFGSPDAVQGGVALLLASVVGELFLFIVRGRPL